MLFDAHLHLGWFSDARAAAREAAGLGLTMYAVTVTPDEYRRVAPALDGERNVALAAGLHPWWVRAASDADALADILPQVRWVGEIGLDAAPRHAETWDAQLAALRRICSTCAGTSDARAPKVLSLHAVRSASAVLDVLEETGAVKTCRCVLHWFSGTSDELWRAVTLGCYCSIGERSLATRRGREYARILPAERLLTETDLPEKEGSPTTAHDVAVSLDRTLASLAELRGLSAEEARSLVAANTTTLLT